MEMSTFAGMLRSDARRALSGLGFWLCIAFSAFAVLQPIWKEMFVQAGFAVDGRDVIDMFTLSSGMGMQTIQIVVGAGVYACSFAQDWERRFFRPLLLRSGKAAYIASRVLVLAASTYVAVVLGQMLALLIASYILPFYKPALLHDRNGGIELVDAGRPFLYCYFLIHQRATYITLWALLALAVSTLVQNRFVVLFTPMLTYFLFSLLEAVVTWPVWAGGSLALESIVQGGNSTAIAAVGLLYLRAAPLLFLFLAATVAGMERRLKRG